MQNLLYINSSKFLITRIYNGYMGLALNPRAMDDKTKPINIYTTSPTNISNEKNNDNLDGIVDGQQELGKLELPHNSWT